MQQVVKIKVNIYIHVCIYISLFCMLACSKDLQMWTMSAGVTEGGRKEGTEWGKLLFMEMLCNCGTLKFLYINNYMYSSCVFWTFREWGYATKATEIMLCMDIWTSVCLSAGRTNISSRSTCSLEVIIFFFNHERDNKVVVIKYGV